MKKVTIFAAVAALALGFTSAGHAQVTSATTSSGATGTAGASANGIGVVNLPGNGGGAAYGTLNTYQSGVSWTLGIAPSMNATQYDACTKYFSLSAIAGGINVPLEIDMCWKMRQMDAMAKYPPGSNQYELGCADSGWLKMDWVTGTMACTENKAKLAKSNPNDQRATPTRGVPVVSTNTGGSILPPPAPPTGAPVPASNRQVSEAPAPQEVCLDRGGNKVRAGTPGSSCGLI